MWIHRTIEASLRSAAATRPVVVVTGARQVGKSSLLRHVFPDHGYVSLDLPSEAHAAETEPEAFLARHPLPLVVDEVQYAPALFRHLKQVVDSRRDDVGGLLLTGSQKFALMQRVSESLAGRAAVLELEPLDFGEITSTGHQGSLDERIVRGGYPELWAQPAIDARSFLSAYIATYLERDLRTMLRVGSLRDFERFLRSCALRSGQLLNKSDLARDVGIAGSTANEWLSLLEASGVVALLEPWFVNQSKRLVKSPKLYLRDSGLLCFLLNVRSADELRESPLRGAIFETATYAELRKRLSRTDEVASLFFYRDRANEVDFVIHRGGRFSLLECKWTELPEERDIVGMRRLAEEFSPERILDRQLVCRTRAPYSLAEARVVPLDALDGP